MDEAFRFRTLLAMTARVSREYAHARAVAMRAAWCARQSPKAWPKVLAPGESAYNLADGGVWLGLDRAPR